jgi:hypothetical protein
MNLSCFKVYADNDEEIIIKRALEFLPKKVIPKVAIYTMSTRFGIVLNNPEISKNYEIIFLSDKIFPPSGTADHNQFFRYFVFIVLHEFAHVLGNESEYDADGKDLEWYNRHVSDEKLELSFLDEIEILATKEIILKREWIFVSEKGDSNKFLSGCVGSGLVNEFLDYCEREGKNVSTAIKTIIREFLDKQLELSLSKVAPNTSRGDHT